jgi:hypothetical protein
VFLRRADLMPSGRPAPAARRGAGRDERRRRRLRSSSRGASAPVRRPSRRAISDPDVAVAPRPRRLPRPRPISTVLQRAGGFADGGREFVIPVHVEAGRMPPAPWSNVVAHARFGFACTESGPGYTWSGNSHDNRLTPWRNDPVSDPPG